MKALLKRWREPLQKTTAEDGDDKLSSPPAANASFLSRRRLIMAIVFGAVFLLTVVYWLGDSEPGDPFGGSLTSGGPSQTHFEVVARPVTQALNLTGSSRARYSRASTRATWRSVCARPNRR